MKILFWNVDTQEDFINKNGKLAIAGAESIKPNLKRLTNLAKKYDITVVNTMDWHRTEDVELSDNPDFVNTFPQHCMSYTEGADFIKETDPKIRLHFIFSGVARNKMPNSTRRNIIIEKNKFDVFEGNPDTEKVLNTLNPEIVIVYGVATNVCVNFAVLGLVARGYKVVVVSDAIKELPQLDVNLVYENWKNAGVRFETTDNIENVVKYIKGE